MNAASSPVATERIYAHRFESALFRGVAYAVVDGLQETCPRAGRPSIQTLRDAGAYVLTLPKSERETPAWYPAAENLMQAAEHGGLWLYFPRIATVQALRGQRRRRRKRLDVHDFTGTTRLRA